MMRPLLLLALLVLLLLPAAGGAASKSWGSSQDEAEAERAESELTLAERIELMETRRKLRRSLQDNRVGSRVSRYRQAAVKAADEGDNEEALRLLSELKLGRMNAHEKALVHQLKAFLAYSAGQPDLAIAEFRKAIAQEILPIKDETRMRFNIAQLSASQHKWPETIAALNDWFEWESDPDPLGFYLRAIAHFQMDEFDEAIADAETAIDRSPEPREGWLQLLAALYVQKEDYDSAAPVLEELVLRFPKRLYWVQLSLIYGAREQYQRSLAVQQVAYAQNLLTQDKELRRLARSYLHANLPYPAAKLLDAHIADGGIDRDAKAYELLANSWIAAREYDRSLEPLLQAAKLADDGNLYVRLGQVHLQREEWSHAAEMLTQALDKGGLKSEGNALLLLGISHYNDDRVGKARRYFAQARGHDETRPQAERWLQHLEAEASGGSETAANPT